VRTDNCEAARKLAPFCDGGKITVAETREKPKQINHNTTMDKASAFSLANRKQLADLLNPYNSLRQNAHERYRAKYREVEQLLLHDYLEEKVGSQLLAEIIDAQQELDVQKEKISALGLDLDGEGLSINYGLPASAKEAIEQQVERRIGKRRDIDARFDSVQLAMMTIATLEDAEKLLKSVSEL
jgi:hypothetical protein